MREATRRPFRRKGATSPVLKTSNPKLCRSHLEISGAIGAIWSYLELSGAIWSYKYLRQSEAIWNYLEVSGVELSGAIWSYLELSPGGKPEAILRFLELMLSGAI